MKYILQILALLCGSIFGIALALMVNFFGYENYFIGFILVAFGFVLLFIIGYRPWKTRKKNKLSSIREVILWVIHNLKFLFMPGSTLEGLDERQRHYELLHPKIHRTFKFKTVFFFIGICTITALCTIAVFQYWISPYTYLELTTYTGLNVHAEWFHPPSPEHLLGQTFFGYDILGRLIFGTRPVLVFTLVSTLISLLIGILIGAISGYFEGWFDTVVMRIIDIILSFPGVIFAIIFITIWGADYIILIVVYSIIGIPYFARLIRTNVIREKVRPYINAGKVGGAKNFRILFRHILPNCLQSIIVATSYNISRNILSLAVLSFLRYGGTGWIEWGLDISTVLRFQASLIYAPWAIVYPCLMILISVIGFLLLGDGLSDAGLLKQARL